MTTQHSTVPRRLRRRSDERVLAGVASGLGDYFNVDPILIRILLVASLVFGGLGIFLYVAAWLLVPDDTSDTSIVQRLVGGGRLPAGVLAVLAIVIVAIVVFGLATPMAYAVPGGGGDGFGAFVLAVLVIGVGIYLFRQRDAASVAVDAEGAADADADAGQAVAPPTVRRPTRPPSPLGWYAIGAGLVGIGLLAIGSNVWNLATEPVHYFGVMFGALGIALLVGAFWGHARFLIVIGLLLLPFAWTASLVDRPIEGGWGPARFEPTTAADVREEYRLAGGELVVDLTRVSDADEPIVVHASVAFGELRVQVPEGATVEVDASVGGGIMRLLDGRSQDGTRLQASQVVEGGDPHFILDLDAGIGAVRVDAIDVEGN